MPSAGAVPSDWTAAAAVRRKVLLRTGQLALDERTVGADGEPFGADALTVRLARRSVTGVEVDRPLADLELLAAVRPVDRADQRRVDPGWREKPLCTVTAGHAAAQASKQVLVPSTSSVNPYRVCPFGADQHLAEGAGLGEAGGRRRRRRIDRGSRGNRCGTGDLTALATGRQEQAGGDERDRGGQNCAQLHDENLSGMG